jgi:hypothetical protein
MKKLLLLLMFATSAFAQEQIELVKTMKCSNAEFVFKYFFEAYGEEPIWVGKDKSSDTFITILKNKEKGNWTLVQYNSAIACVLGAGEQGTPI